MKIKYSHSLSLHEAYRRVSNLLAELQNKYSEYISNPQTKWNADNTKMDFSMEVKGFSVKGKIILTDKLITVEGELPFLARIFKGKIEAYIMEALEKLFK